jgi:hypothetical protein
MAPCQIMRERNGGWAAKQEDMPPRSVSIRRLIEMSLAERRAGTIKVAGGTSFNCIVLLAC